MSLIVQKLVREKLATYQELSTVYSLEDALNILEINEVGNYNDRQMEEVQKAVRGGR